MCNMATPFLHLAASLDVLLNSFGAGSHPGFHHAYLVPACGYAKQFSADVPDFAADRPGAKSEHKWHEPVCSRER